MLEEFVIDKGVLKKYCGSSTDVVIPEGVISIGENAFYEGNLTGITIPNSVTKIEDYAFSWCGRLKNVIIPDRVTYIGKQAFLWCEALKSVVIPDSVTEIGEQAFSGCRNLTSAVISNSVTKIGTKVFSGCSSLTSLTIPERVESIGNQAFSGCSSLTDITFPDSLKSIEGWAFSWCSSLKSIIIPESVTNIGYFAFGRCSSLTNITIPDSVTGIDEDVFVGCTSLETITFLGDKFKFGKTPFGIVNYKGEGGIPQGLKDKCYSLIPRFADGSLKEYILKTDLWGTLTSEQQAEIFISRQSKTLTPGYLKCITDDQLKPLGDALEECLDNKPSAKECVATALYMTGFKEKIPAEKLQKLYALLKPLKAASKALSTIDNDLVLKEKLGQKLTVDEELAPAERKVMERLIFHKMSQRDLEALLKEYYGITYADLPTVSDKDGKEKEPYVLAWLLQAHENVITHWGIKETDIVFTKNEICQDAKDILDEVDEDSFQAALLELSKRFLAKYVNTKKKYLCYPICRYADETVMAELTKEAPKWRTSVSGIDAPPLLQFRIGCLYNNTRTAMLFAERYHDLDRYAQLRGTDADTLRNTVLSEFGLDETGKKLYDLGNTILVAELQDDLTISLYDQGAKKTVKSVPKKNADPEKYEDAKADLADIRKNVKKVAKARNNALFNDFLTGKKYEAENWKKIHYSNPLLNKIARLLVWEQEGATFTLSAAGAIDHDGMTYEINKKPIRLAHPMGMKQPETEAWQKYFVSQALKQPFAQVWEPVQQAENIHDDRYKGIMIPFYRFRNQEKHGITVLDNDFHNDIQIMFKNCNAYVERIDWHRHEIDNNDRFEIQSFSFKKYSRTVNHIVAYLDRITVFDRIRKDDQTIENYLKGFTLEQVLECIKIANESQSKNCIAMLLEEKNKRWPEYSGVESLLLDE